MAIRDLLAKSFLFNLFSLARFSHAKKYLLKTFLRKTDPYKMHVLAKDKQRSLCIWAIKQIPKRREHFADDLYFWEFGTEKWLANLDHIHGLYEYLNGTFQEIYNCACRNKIVLDIGGYIGDSARYFLEQGARKIIIYEPVKKNIECLKQNLQRYHQKVKIVPKAVGERDGKMTIHSNYPGGHIGFGNRAGRYSITTTAESFSSILKRNKADIAKIDCEGNEKYLLDLQEDELRRIPYWMIEVHDAQIGGKLDQKFHFSGFEKITKAAGQGHLSIFHYRLVA